MVNSKATSLDDIKGLLEKAQNPLFLYDDDPDGLCSYLLLKRKFNKGQGLVVKTTPKLGTNFFQNIEKRDYDLLVILDKPIVEQEFINKINTPIIYIDHHPLQELKGIHYYNPRYFDDKDNSPTTKICYDIVKQDEWIAAIGIIGDWFLPKFISRLVKQYPDLIKKTKDPAKIMFNQKFGKLTRIFLFILKGDNNDVRNCVNILETIKSPYDVLSENGLLKTRFDDVNKVYESLMDDALKGIGKEKLIVFSYISGRYSLTGEIANELYYRHPRKFVVVGREKDNEMRMSLRGKKISKHLNNALKGIKGYGGGHENACGGAVAKEDFVRFLDNLKTSIA